MPLFSLSSKTTVTLLFYLTLPFLRTNVVVNAEEEISESESLEDYERLCLILLSVILSYFTSLFGNFYLYLSILENRIMRKYRGEGIFVEGTISRSTFEIDGDESIGFVSVEYTMTSKSEYPVTVKKQFQVFESDISVIKESEPKENCGNRTVKGRNVIKIEDPESLVGQSDFDIPQKRIDIPQKRIDLMVLDEYPSSAIPTKELERKLTYHHKLVPITVLFCSSCICICFYLFSYYQIVTDNDTEMRKEIWFIFWISLGLILLQFPSIHYFFGWKLNDMLEDNFFRTGNIGTGVIGREKYGDDSTISTAGTATILARHKVGILSLTKQYSTLSGMISMESLSTTSGAASKKNRYFRMGR
jgi:hypothetical protein